MKHRFPYLLGKLPILNIKILYKDKKVSLSSLIDTGADYTIFSREVAEKLGIRVEEGEMIVLEGAGGNIIGYLHSIKILLCNREIEIIACFSEKDDVPEHILGRKDVINNFKLTLSKDWFELESYTDEKEE